MPTIFTQPADLTVTVGATATFTIDATGESPLRYQWERNGFPIPGATNSSYTLSAVRRTHSDFYSVVVEDTSGARISSLRSRLSVLPSTQPAQLVPDPAWNLHLERETEVPDIRASLILPDGSFYIAGNFSSIHGSRRRHIARINRDGTLHQGFVPPESDGTVTALAVQSDGKLLLIGTFTYMGGHLRPRIARLNVDGTVDPTFRTSLDAAAGDVNALLLLPDGKILVGGDIPGGVIRCHSTGVTDLSYNAQVEGSVSALVLQPDGRVFVAGDFRRVSRIPREYLVRLDPQGALDPTFSPEIATYRTRAMALQADGKLVLVSDATGFQESLPSKGIVRLTPTGAWDRTFNVGGGLVQGFINCVVLDAAQHIWLAGRIGIFNQQSVGSILRLTPSGTIDAVRHVVAGETVNALSLNSRSGASPFEYDVLVAGPCKMLVGPRTDTVAVGVGRFNESGIYDPALSLTFRRPAPARALAPLPDGKLLLGGDFTFARGTAVPAGVIRVNVDGNVDPTFNPAGAGISGHPAPTVVRVNSIRTQPDGRVVIAGLFTGYNGTPRNGVARLTADGRLDPTFATNTGTYTSATAIEFLPDGRLLLAGAFGETTAVVALKSDGSLDRSFNSPRFSLQPLIYALAVQRDGRVLMGGTRAEMGSTPVGYLARLQTDGSLDADFTRALGSGLNGQVHHIAVMPNGKILAGGEFGSVAGGAGRGISRLNPDGSPDLTFATHRIGNVDTFAALADDTVFARVSWSAYARPQSHFVRLKAAGEIDAGFEIVGLGRPGPFGTMVVLDDGRIVCSGNGFDHGVVMLAPRQPPSIITPPVAQTVTRGGTATFRVAVAPTFLPPSYQWFRNGEAIAGATDASLTINNARMSDAGEYTVRVSSDSGTVITGAVTLSGKLTGSRLANVSTRSTHGAGERALIAGFVMRGSDPKPMLVRAVGPSLSTFGLTDPLSDPILDILQGQALAATNDDWASASGNAGAPAVIAATTSRVGGFPLLTDSRDAAVLVTLPPGAYSALIRTAAPLGGTAIIEVYDASDPLADSSIANLSTRAHVDASNMLIAGMVIDGTEPRGVLIRAAGPALGGFGVAGALSDPVVQVFRDGVLLATNDNWSFDPLEAAGAMAAARQVAAFDFSAGSRDSALVRRFEPGAYTIQVSGNNGTAGVALLEIYDLP